MFEKSLSKLLPLKEKLQKTDWLIDQIIDRLYGLTMKKSRLLRGINKANGTVIANRKLETQNLNIMMNQYPEGV